MTYTLWDARTTNLIAAYDNELNALAVVLSGIERNGQRDTDTLVLEIEDEDGELITSFQGVELAALAREKLKPGQIEASRSEFLQDSGITCRHLLCSCESRVRHRRLCFGCRRLRQLIKMTTGLRSVLQCRFDRRELDE